MTPLEYQLQNYNLEFEGLTQEDGGRGILIYIHESLQYNKLDPDKILKLDAKIRCDFVACELKLSGNDKLLFCNAYRSPSCTQEENNIFNSALKKLNCLNYAQFLLVGDFNHPGIDWDTGSTVSTGEDSNFHFHETIRDCYLTQHIVSPTRGRGTDTPSTLDLVFTSAHGNIEFLDIGAPLGNNDHAMINFGYRCTPEPSPDKITYKYD